METVTKGYLTKCLWKLHPGSCCIEYVLEHASLQWRHTSIMASQITGEWYGNYDIIMWDVAVHGRDLHLVKPTLGPPKNFQHLTRAEEVITPLRIGHTKATKSHILSRGPPTVCHHCGQTLTIDHMVLECAVLQECRDEYYTVDSLNTLFETIPETCIVEFLREAGFFYLIWYNLLTSTSPQTWTILSELSNMFREWEQLWGTFTWVGRLMCTEGSVVAKQIQSNQSCVIPTYQRHYYSRSVCIVIVFLECKFTLDFDRWPDTSQHGKRFHFLTSSWFVTVCFGSIGLNSVLHSNFSVLCKETQFLYTFISMLLIVLVSLIWFWYLVHLYFFIFHLS